MPNFESLQFFAGNQYRIKLFRRYKANGTILLQLRSQLLNAILLFSGVTHALANCFNQAQDIYLQLVA
jgi:hypothetical protein